MGIPETIIVEVRSRRVRGGGGGHINDCRVFAAVTHFITGEEESERMSGPFPGRVGRTLDGHLGIAFPF